MALGNLAQRFVVAVVAVPILLVILYYHRPEQLDADRLGSYLPTANLPPLDLLIRTSGEQRISNFMLWEVAYAELVFVDVLWPDFRRTHLHACLEAFGSRERRYGLTSAQLAETSDV